MKPGAEAGFTVVELVVVIVIIGILAAVGVPRFMGFQAEARVAAVKSLGGTLKSAANMAHGVCLAQGCANNSTITIQGRAITFVNSYPTNATIGLLLPSTDGFTASSPGSTFTKSDARTINCWVRYTEAAEAGQAPTITYRLGAITDAQIETNVNDDLRTQC